MRRRNDGRLISAARSWLVWYFLVMLASCSPPLEAKDLVVSIEATDGGLELDLETETISLGGGPANQRVFEGSLALGAWEIFSLPPRSPSESRSFYLVRLPLTFRLLEEGRRFRNFHLRLELKTATGIVEDLFPRSIAEPTEVLCFGITPTLQFREPPETSVTGWFVLEDLKPWLLALGSRQRIFDWVFEGSRSGGLSPGDHELFFILSLPTAADEVELQVTGQSLLAKEWLGFWYDTYTVPVDHPVRLSLDRAVSAAEIFGPASGTSLPAACRAENQAVQINAPPEPDSVPRVSGWWQSDFGMLVLEQKGRQIEGTYSCCAGSLSGTLDGQELDLTWQDPISGRGWVRFQVDDDGLGLEGEWGREGQPATAGAWNASRWQNLEYSGTPSYWGLEGANPVSGQLSGKAILYEDGELVRGELHGVYVLTNSRPIVRQPIANRVSGRRTTRGLALEWEDLIFGGRGTMTLEQRGERWEGTWISADGASSREITFVRLDDDPGSADPAMLTRTIDSLDDLTKARRWISEGELLLTTQELGQALERFDQALEKIPERHHEALRARVLFGRGQCLRQLQRHEKADQAFEEILQLDAGDNWHLLARMALDQFP